LLIFISAMGFLLAKSFTVYEWTTAQDIPLIQSLLENNFLTTDFYTQSIQDSPKYYFVLPYVLLDRLGVPWEYSLYFTKCLLVILFPVLFFNLIMKSLKSLKLQEKIDFSVLGLLICIVLGLDLVGFVWNKGGVPVGWVSFTSLKKVIPMTLSTFFALIFCLNSHKYVLGTFLLLLSTFIHPVMGLCVFLLFYAFKFAGRIDKQLVKRALVQFVIGVVLPIIVIKLKYKAGSMAAEDFITHYVYIRHSHHYSILHNFNWKSILFGLGFVIPLWMYRKNTRLLKFNILAILLYFGAMLIQLVGVELLKVKPLAVLGVSRFTTFCSIIFLIQYTYIFVDKFKESNLFKKLNQILEKIDNKLNKKILSQLNPVITGVVVAFVLSISTVKEPIEHYRKGELKEVVTWIKENTKINETFYLDEKVDSFIFRSYARRPVYADKAFPFNEDNIKEFSKRYLIYKKSKEHNWESYQCLSLKENVTYLLIRNSLSKDFPDSFREYKDKKYSVFKLPKALQCNLSKLIKDYDKYKDVL
jgi:hypothetical protein